MNASLIRILSLAILAGCSAGAYAGLVVGEVQFNAGDVSPSPIVAVGDDLLQTSVASATGENSEVGIRNGLTGTAVEDGPQLARIWGQATTTYALDLAANPGGYDIQEIRVFSGWSDRASQAYEIWYSLVGDPETFVRLGDAILANVGEPGALLTRTYDSTGDFILRRAAAIRFVQAGITPVAGSAVSVGTETVFREFDVLGTPASPPSAPEFTAEPMSQTVNYGSTLTLASATTGFPEPTYVWSKDGVVLPDQTGATLTLGPVSFSDAGSYTVTASNSLAPDGVTSQPAVVSVVVPRPAPFADPGTLRTGSQIFYRLIEGDTVPAGLTFRARGLPAGLKLDPLTGIISGTLSSGPRTVTFTTWTQVGSKRGELRTITLVIGPFPAELVGSSEVLLQTAGEGRRLPVGKLTLKIAANGTFTGTLITSDRKPFPLSGRGKLAADNESVSAELRLSRSSATPYRLTFTRGADPVLEAILAEGDNVLGSGDDGVSIVAVASPGSAGAYTALFGSPVNYGENDEYPRGKGYAGVTVDANGALSIRGKNADGTSLTASLAHGADDSYRLYVKPYSQAGGYVAGGIRIRPRWDDAERWQVSADGDTSIYWNKPAPAAASANYGLGFGPLELPTRMESWVRPTGSASLPMLLNLDEGGSIVLSIRSSGLSNDEGNSYLLPSGLTLSDANEITVRDETSVPFTAQVNPRTGAISGSFTLPAEGEWPKRKINYAGVLLQTESEDRAGLVGGGYFLLRDGRFSDSVLSGAVTFSRSAR